MCQISISYHFHVQTILKLKYLRLYRINLYNMINQNILVIIMAFIVQGQKSVYLKVILLHSIRSRPRVCICQIHFATMYVLFAADLTAVPGQKSGFPKVIISLRAFLRTLLYLIAETHAQGAASITKINVNKGSVLMWKLNFQDPVVTKLTLCTYIWDIIHYCSPY